MSAIDAVLSQNRAVGDFNGDGKPDLAVANYFSNTISILLGRGDGTFRGAISYAVGVLPGTVVAGDFNGDGKRDLAVANRGAGEGENTVSILLGKGDGTFQPALNYSVGSNPHSLAAGDFNRDGIQDLVLADSSAVWIMLGKGDGTFQPAVSYAASERRACRLLHQPRGTQRYQPTQRPDESRLTQAIIALTCQYGRYGYRRITALLKVQGWFVGKDRVQRIWRREGLKVPAKQKPRARLWLNDGSSIRLRPERENHVWSYDFVEARTHDGRSLRLLTMIDEFTRECLAIRVARRLNSAHVIEVLGECMLEHGVPEHVRSDNGAEMTARRVKQWLRTVGTRPLFIEPGSPWENGYCESFNGKLRDECLNGEIFYSLKEAQVVVGMWQKHYNTVRPHSVLGYRTPAPLAWIPAA